jgi:troponin T
MYSRYERQKDKRTFGDRHEVFHGPTWKYPAKRIRPHKIVRWDEEGLPIYEQMEGVGPEEEEAEEDVEQEQ